jgi:hypothetical protein
VSTDNHDLDERVFQFRLMELPGQPMMMHMGTSRLVNDLHAELKRVRARVAELEAKEDLMCDLHYANGAKQGFSWGQVSDENALHQCVSARMSAGVSELFELRKAGGGL